MATIVIENYLKALYSLSQKNEAVSLTDLSKELEVSAPTVNNMIKKLQEKGCSCKKIYITFQIAFLENIF